MKNIQFRVPKSSLTPKKTPLTNFWWFTVTVYGKYLGNKQDQIWKLRTKKPC